MTIVEADGTGNGIRIDEDEIDEIKTEVVEINEEDYRALRLKDLTRRVLDPNRYPTPRITPQGFMFGDHYSKSKFYGYIRQQEASTNQASTANGARIHLHLNCPVPHVKDKNVIDFQVNSYGVTVFYGIASKDRLSGKQIRVEYDTAGKLRKVSPSDKHYTFKDYRKMRKAGIPTEEELPSIIDPVATLEYALGILALVSAAETSGATLNPASQGVPFLVTYDD